MNTPSPTMKMRFDGSDDRYSPPSQTMSLEAALLWLGRLYHPGINRIVRLDGNRFTLDNRRRGCNRRACVIIVEGP